MSILGMTEWVSVDIDGQLGAYEKIKVEKRLRYRVEGINRKLVCPLGTADDNEPIVISNLV